MTTATDEDRLVAQLDTAASSDDFVSALRRSAALARHAGRSTRPHRLAAALAEFATTDDYAALLAIESLAALPDGAGDPVLTDLLVHPAGVVRRHAAWRLGDRPPSDAAIGPLLELVADGGIDTLHAHRTLRTWAAKAATSVAPATRLALTTTTDVLPRARLLDLLGRIDADDEAGIIRRIAADPSEPVETRVAAIRALESCVTAGSAALLRRLATHDDDVAAYAALALESCDADPARHDHREGGGQRIAQLVLAGGLDGQLSLGGRGDTGGVASLLVSLGTALARRDDVAHVLTIGRGAVGDALMGPPLAESGRPSFGMVAVGAGRRSGAAPDELWEHVPTLEREIARVLRTAGPVDVLHLRMADAGTLAGATVAAQLGIPICFSVAPDPHNVVQSLQGRGELDRRSFVRLDEEQHVWFRARLVERLARDADRLALFPRAEPRRILSDLGVDGDDRRAAVVPEGIDLELIRRAEARPHPLPTAVALQRDAVAELADRIPEHRRGLPLLLSVGRLHPVKGMERVARAWGRDRTLSERCNLVIVGGDLDDPSTIERAVLDAIDRAVPAGHDHRDGLVLLGGRPRADVARLLVAAADGAPGSWAPGGVYVDGALKEEFGLAVLEALAAGLPVVAPSTGGPATYVDDGDTGILVDPDADLGRAIADAFALTGRPGRRKRARTMVEDRYSVAAMAEHLTRLYETGRVAA